MSSAWYVTRPWSRGHSAQSARCSATPDAGKQYVVTLKGEGEIELANGQKIVARAGDVLLMEDVTGKRHISRGRGTDDRITLFIPVAD
jgi:hypothetical protein